MPGSPIRILVVGDIVGSPGRRILAEGLEGLRASLRADLVFVNVENASRGMGITPKSLVEIQGNGVDLMLGGDHAYDRKELPPVFDEYPRLLRPANFPPGAPGRSWGVARTRSGVRVGLTTVVGRVFMKPADCPFHAVDRVLGEMANQADVFVVEIHAEATSEKIALGWYLDGRVSFVFGTHTHVATADERILPKGTAYITDLGMTGAHDGVLGRVKEKVLSSLLTRVPTRYDVSGGDVRLCGAIVEIDPATRRALSIERVEWKG